jgi:hypothetical protein
MFAQVSRRGIHFIRTPGRHLNVPQFRLFHLPPSPLLPSVDPRKRNLLPGLARANATFALQTRGLQGSAIPKFLLKAFRVPAGGIAIITAGFAYVNYKVQGRLGSF